MYESRDVGRARTINDRDVMNQWPRANFNDRPTLAPAVKSVLGELRRRIRQYVWLEGLARGGGVAGLAFWVTLAADWFFEPSALVRGLMLGAVAVVLAVIVCN